MDAIELEANDWIEDDGPHTGTLVELVVAASDGSEDLWEIADRVDAAISSGRVRLDALV